MIEKKIVVPDGMLKAARKRLAPNKWKQEVIKLCIEDSLRWLSENPIVPTISQIQDMEKGSLYLEVAKCVRRQIREWQRRMFLAAGQRSKK
jgi:hypothetical protein